MKFCLFCLFFVARASQAQNSVSSVDLPQELAHIEIYPQSPVVRDKQNFWIAVEITPLNDSIVNWNNDGPFYPASQLLCTLPSHLSLVKVIWPLPQVSRFANALRVGYTRRFVILLELAFNSSVRFDSSKSLYKADCELDLCIVHNEQYQIQKEKIPFALPRVLFPQEVPKSTNPFVQSLFKIAREAIPVPLAAARYELNWNKDQAFLSVWAEDLEQESPWYLVLAQSALEGPSPFWVYPLTHHKSEGQDRLWLPHEAKKLLRSFKPLKLYLINPLYQKGYCIDVQDYTKETKGESKEIGFFTQSWQWWKMKYHSLISFLPWTR